MVCIFVLFSCRWPMRNCFTQMPLHATIPAMTDHLRALVLTKWLNWSPAHVTLLRVAMGLQSLCLWLTMHAHVFCLGILYVHIFPNINFRISYQAKRNECHVLCCLYFFLLKKFSFLFFFFFFLLLLLLLFTFIIHKLQGCWEYNVFFFLSLFLSLRVPTHTRTAVRNARICLQNFSLDSGI